MSLTSEKKAESYPLLFEIDCPEDLRKLSRDKLPQLVDELRRFLIESVSNSGGHFAAGLGVIELTIALHFIYNTPYDKLVWDVGHLCYPHKILTGRRDQIHTIRKTGGLASFPERSESHYDSFGVGHAGTAISAALGMSLGYAQQKQDNQVVAIVGDGGMTAGLSYEALNHAGDTGADLLVILNDNNMSISPNVGALRHHLGMLASTPLYQSLYRNSQEVLGLSRLTSRLAGTVREAVRGAATHDTIFSALGFQYFGPIDGHDLLALTSILHNLTQISGPRLLHIVTTKGKGYLPAENNPVHYHGVGAFDPDRGIEPKTTAKPTFSDLFSQWIVAQGERDERLCAITPAMREGSGLIEFERRFPDRYFDVGIAEQHAVTLASGLACAGQKPVVAIYSTFLQRAYDQLIHDVCLQNLDVTFAVDRAGVVGGDGATHNGAYDMAFARILSGLVIATPSNAEQATLLLNAVYHHRGPALIRYPKAYCADQLPQISEERAEIGKAVYCRRGEHIAILAFGVFLAGVDEIAEEMNATLIDMRFVAPLDTECLHACMQTHPRIVTLEEGVIAGGCGESVAVFAQSQGYSPRILHLGLPSKPVPHGVREELLSRCDLADARERIRRWLDQ